MPEYIHVGDVPEDMQVDPAVFKQGLVMCEGAGAQAQALADAGLFDHLEKVVHVMRAHKLVMMEIMLTDNIPSLLAYQRPEVN